MHSFTGQCPAGTQVRVADDMEDCSAGGCDADSCCRMTCAGANNGAGVTCPAGQAPKTEMCNEPGTGYDECDADTCCYTPYVVGSIAPGASATDTGFDFTYEQFSDVACTTRKTDFEGGMVTGTSATCVPGRSQGGWGTTLFGFYAYCPGLTGTGAYEYVLASEGADRCPPAAGAEGGASARFTCRQPAHAMRVFRAVLSPPRRRWLLCRWRDSRCQRVRCLRRRIQKADMQRSHAGLHVVGRPLHRCPGRLDQRGGGRMRYARARAPARHARSV